MRLLTFILLNSMKVSKIGRKGLRPDRNVRHRTEMIRQNIGKQTEVAEIGRKGLKPNRSVEQRNEIIRTNVGNGRKRPKSFGTVHNRGEESDIRHKGTWWNKSSLFVVIKISKG